MNAAQAWLATQAASGFPGLCAGDLMVSWFYGDLSTLISWFQGRRGVDMVGTPPSHTAVHLGSGMLAESVFPRAQEEALEAYATAKHTATLYRRLDWTLETRARVAAAAVELVYEDTLDPKTGKRRGRFYDLAAYPRHVVDNFVERLTWSTAKQSGARPLSRLFGDPDGASWLDCSELVERAVFKGSAEYVDPGNRFGLARPLDVLQWLRRTSAAPVVTFHRGSVVVHAAGRTPGL